MEFSTQNAFNESAEIADSVNYPDIRMFTAARAVADAAQVDVDDKTGGRGVYANSSWAVSAPAAFDTTPKAFSWFSAVCYFFGRDVYKSLGGKVPIGLVASDDVTSFFCFSTAGVSFESKACHGGCHPR
jgi:hypothetical protein